MKVYSYSKKVTGFFIFHIYLIVLIIFLLIPCAEYWNSKQYFDFVFRISSSLFFLFLLLKPWYSYLQYLKRKRDRKNAPYIFGGIIIDETLKELISANWMISGRFYGIIPFEKITHCEYTSYKHDGIYVFYSKSRSLLIDLDHYKSEDIDEIKRFFIEKCWKTEVHTVAST